MSQKIYTDEAKLTARLDKLLSTATAPTPATSLYTDTTIAPTQLPSGYALANQHLSAIGITSLPPLPSDIKNGSDEILAAAFTAIIRLSQGAQANKSLRESAEASQRHSTSRIEDLSKRLEMLDAKLKKKDVLIATMRNAETETASKHRVQLRKLSAECNQLRSRLVHAGHRENQLLLSAKKKEKEFGQLQSRVHALFKTSASIDTRITRVGNRISPRSGESLDASVDDIGEDRIVAVERENDVMRGLLQAVQEELDDLILSHGSGETASDVPNEFDVPPAPGDEVMALPMDVIDGALQDCLERKFGILRRAFERGGPLDEYGHDDATDEDDFVDADDGEDHALVRSADHNLESVSGNTERNDGDEQSSDTDAGGIKMKTAQVDAESVSTHTQMEPIDNEAEQVNEEGRGVDADAGGSERPAVSTEPVEAQAEQDIVNAEPLDGDAGSSDSSSIPTEIPVDTEATPEAEPADAYAKSVGKSNDLMNDIHETLANNLKMLAITEPTKDETEPSTSLKTNPD